jgi:hypothetical protein
VAGNRSHNENTFLQKNLIGLLYYDLLANVCIRVCLVRSGATVVRTKRSGALLKCALGCALLAHFASKVRSSQAKCALKIGVCRPSAHLRAPQTDFATCALHKCASRAQNPTFAPYLRTSFWAEIEEAQIKSTNGYLHPLFAPFAKARQHPTMVGPSLRPTILNPQISIGRWPGRKVRPQPYNGRAQLAPDHTKPTLFHKT